MNEVIFNGLRLNDYMIVKSIKESIMPSISNNTKDIPLKRGSKYINKKLDSKIIQVDFEIQANSFTARESLLDTINNKLYTEEEEVLKLRGNRYYYASLDGSTDLNNLVTNGEGSMTFLATDPIKFGQSKSINLSGTTTINVAGTYKTDIYLTYNFTNATSYIIFTDLPSGKYVRIDHDFKEGDVLIIDFKDKWKARKNGNVIAEDIYITSDFFQLKKGNNRLNTTTPCTLDYIERWL